MFGLRFLSWGCFEQCDDVRRGLDSVQSSVAQLNALKEQMEGAQSVLRKVETSTNKAVDGHTNNQA